MAATNPTTRREEALGCLGQVLSHPRRQCTLDALAAIGDNRTSLDALAAAVAAREFEDDRSHLDRVTNALHHVHLPKLAELGILSYDYETGEVTPDHERIDELRLAAERAASALGGA